MLDQLIQQKLDSLADRFIEKISLEIRDKKVTKYGAVNSSGNLINSIEKRKLENGIEVIVDGYAYQLIYGRKPGTMPPKEAISDWIDQKGLQYDISKDSLIYLIRRKIAQRGTLIFEEYRGGESGLFAKSIEQAEEEYFEEIGNIFLNEFESELLKVVAA